ncbi:MAG: DNA repair protein RecO [Bacteroidota bacterium]
MQLKTTGIVFRSVKYAETSVIADIFTEDKGLHTFIAGGVRSAKARMPYSLFQPMMVVDLVAYYRDDPNSMNRLREMRVAEVWQRIPFDIRRGAVALFMAEICRKCIQETEENRELFQFLIHTLRWLDQTEQPIANLHLHFLLALTGFLGFQPHTEYENLSGKVFFDLKEGIFTTERPFSSAFIDPDGSNKMLELMSTPLELCHEVVLPKSERKALLGKLLQFYELHVPGFSGVNTPYILEMVLE